MIAVGLRAVGIAAPGLPCWAAAQAVLRGAAPYVPGELPPWSSPLLPANERRRAPPAVRQAFRAAEDAVAAAALDAATLASVFASSDADLGIIDKISLSLSEPARIVSPIDFHNSVHNAAAGYWSIATGARRPSSSISAYDASLAAGLLEAAVFVQIERCPVLLVVYDVPAPPLLISKRPIRVAFSAALVLDLPQTAGPTLTLKTTLDSVTGFADAALEQLRRDNPAARILPLLAAIARREAASIAIEQDEDQALSIDYVP